MLPEDGGDLAGTAEAVAGAETAEGKVGQGSVQMLERVVCPGADKPVQIRGDAIAQVKPADRVEYVPSDKTGGVIDPTSTEGAQTGRRR